MKIIIKPLITLIIIVLLAVVIYFKVFIPKHTFKIIKPISGQLKISVKGIGNVDALNIYSITAQTGGRILQILTDEGNWVKKGKLLIVMDGVDLAQQLEMAKADLVKSEYDVKALQSELKNQYARKALIKITYNRYKRLNKLGFAARSEYDKAQADLQSINADITATIARIDSARSGAVGASKNIKAVQEKISRLKIYAPVDGYVIAKYAEIAQNVLPTTPILKIVDPKTLWVRTKIDERISAQVKPLQKAIIILRSQPSRRYRGVVKRINAVSDAVTLERTINVAFEKIPNPFFINEQAQVIINVKKYGKVTKIPLGVVVQKQGKTGMWVVKNGRAHFTALGKTARSETEMAIPDRFGNYPVIVPDFHKKTLSEGMRIYSEGMRIYKGKSSGK